MLATNSNSCRNVGWQHPGACYGTAGASIAEVSFIHRANCIAPQFSQGLRPKGEGVCASLPERLIKELPKFAARNAYLERNSAFLSNQESLVSLQIMR